MHPALIALIVAAIVAVVIIIVILVLDAPWLKQKIKEKQFAKQQNVVEKHKVKKENLKVVFCDSKDLVDTYIQQKMKESKPVSKEELLKMQQVVKDKPYIIAYEDGTEAEAIRPEKTDSKITGILKENDGIIVFS